MDALVQPEMTVLEFLRRWPAAIPVFFKHRMACVGCSMAPYDTLEEVAATYHLEPSEFYAELARILQNSTPDDPHQRRDL